MKRDFDLVRELLMHFEEKPNDKAEEVPIIEGYDDGTIKYHLILLYQAGLLRCEPVTSSTSDRVIYVLAFDLTWEGHEFLAKIRNENTWSKIKTTILSRGGAFAYNIVNKLATDYAIQTVAGQ